MNMSAELQGRREQLAIAHLAVAFTLLALAPYDGWTHEGSPAEMAVYVIKTAAQRGNLGLVERALGL